MGKEKKLLKLFEAVQENNINGVNYILRKKRHLINVKHDGETVLHIASEKGCEDIIRLLVAYGACVNATNRDGWTPLHAACMYSQFEAVKILIENEANPNTKCDLGNTPLHNCARSGNTEIARELLSRISDINEQNTDGWTALHRAVSSRQLQMTKLLLAENADVRIKNHAGKSAYDLACDMMYYEIAQVIQNYQKNEHIVKQAHKSTKQSRNALWGIFKREKKPTAETNDNDNNNTEQTKENLTVPIFRNMKTKSNYIFGLFKIKPNQNKETENKESRSISVVNESESVKDDVGFDDEFECPVCFEVPLPPTHVYQCHNGHIYCGNCKSMPNMFKCPQCGDDIAGLNNRNRYAEENIMKAQTKLKK